MESKRDNRLLSPLALPLRSRRSVAQPLPDSGETLTMSTDVIERAGNATRDIKSEIRRVKMHLELIDLSCNAFGVLCDHRMAIFDIETAINALVKIQRGLLDTHWPSEAEYNEV